MIEVHKSVSVFAAVLGSCATQMSVACLAQQDQLRESEFQFEDFGIKTMPLGSPRQTGVLVFDFQLDFDELQHGRIDALVVELHLMQRAGIKPGDKRYDGMETLLGESLNKQFDAFVARLEIKWRTGREGFKPEHIRLLRKSKKEFLFARMEVLESLIQDGDVPGMIASGFDETCRRLGIEVSDGIRIQGLLRNRDLNKTQGDAEWQQPKFGTRHLRLRTNWKPLPEDY